MNVKNLFKNVLSTSKKYTDDKQKTGTFSVLCPRLNNQNIPFNYVQFGDRFLVAVAHITANTSADTGRLYLLFSGGATNMPFNPAYGFGCASLSDVEYPINSSYSNNNVWLGGIRGNVASGKKLDISLILVGGVTKLLTYLASLLNRKAVMA